MNKSLLNTIFAAALSAVSVSVFAADDAPPAAPPDQVVASFERLLTHSSTPMAVAETAASKSETDPLRDSVNTVLWAQPSYHLPVTYAFKSEKARRHD